MNYLPRVNNRVRDLLLLGCLTVSSTLLLWLPFLFLPNGFQTVLKNYDGLNYIIVAKSLYNTTVISTFPQSLPPIYFAAHFPLFPVLIRVVAPLLGYLHSMLFVTLLFSVTSIWAFYLLLQELKLSQSTFWLCIIFLFLPARWLVVRSVGAPEPLFITALLLSILFFYKALNQNALLNFTLSGIFGAVAMATRSPAILLFLSYILYLAWDAYQNTKAQKRNILKIFRYKAFPLLLIPVTLGAVFILYNMAYHDFFAYFHSGDNIHLLFPPFQVFDARLPWVGSIWLEDIVFYFLLYTAATIALWKQQRYPLAFFASIYLLATFSVAHRDIARYSLPLAPLTIIAFHEYFERNEFRLALLIIAAAIYLYAINFISNNTFPAATLAPYL